jgi:hypothetical protein
MPYYLRAIYSNLEWDNPDYSSWLQENELPSCIVRDLRADDNALSLWEISDDQSNLLDIIAAFVSSSSRGLLKDNFDYALLSSNYLDDIRFMPIKKPARTPYTIFNDYHRDIPNLSLNQVVHFAYLLSRHGVFERMGCKEIKNRLEEARAKDQLELTQMKPGLKKKLDAPK